MTSLKKQIKVIDDYIPKKEQEEIKKTLLGSDFLWQYVDDVSIKDNIHQKRPGFKHQFVHDSVVFSNHISVIRPLVDLKRVINARSFLQLPLNKEFIGRGVDTPHLDLTSPHNVILYYVCDSDGDTILYNYLSKDENDIPYFEDIKVEKKVKPKQGRAVLFNGLIWHTAEQPTKNERCIININARV